jgi:hypothetical protein
LGLFIWTLGKLETGFYESPKLKDMNKNLLHTKLKMQKYNGHEYYTCEEFGGEMDAYTYDKKYTPGYLYYCAQINTWNFLKHECSAKNPDRTVDLKTCPHPRSVPGYKYFDRQMKLHAHLRRLLVLVARFQLKHKDQWEYHLISGSALGMLRHMDVIPHDHDADISVKDKAARNFLLDRINEFPDDINISKSSHWTYLKLMSMNGCLQESHLPPFMDIFTTDEPDEEWQTTRAWIHENTNDSDLKKDPHPWTWERDVAPIQHIQGRGYEWPIPNNWTKEIITLYKGAPALTYVPFIVDKEAHNYVDETCTNQNPENSKEFWKFKVKVDEQTGLLKRADV